MKCSVKDFKNWAVAKKGWTKGNIFKALYGGKCLEKEEKYFCLKHFKQKKEELR